MTAYNSESDYTVISLKELDLARAQVRDTLRKMAKENSTKYKIRTFYFGPRSYRGARTTNKSVARAAKIAVYEVVNDYPSLSYYI